MAVYVFLLVYSLAFNPLVSWPSFMAKLMFPPIFNFPCMKAAYCDLVGVKGGNKGERGSEKRKGGKRMSFMAKLVFPSICNFPCSEVISNIEK